MLFKPEHKYLILDGKKTVTRRVWKKPMVKIGGIYKCKLKMLSKDYFAKIKVTKFFKQRLGDMNQEDVLKEGYKWNYEFMDIWKKINGIYDPVLEVDVIEFEVVKDSKSVK